MTQEKTSDREEILFLCLKEIEKKFGKGSVMKLGESKCIAVEAISTGILSLDVATGIGGLPRGRITEIFGPESSGKTTVALHTIAEAQNQGGIAAFIDAEHALDPSYAKALGVNIDNLLISQPDTGEQALEICDYLVKSGAVDVIVIDSVAALVPEAEIKGEMGKDVIGLQARLMSQALRKLTATVSKTNTIVIFINQLREKIGNSYGNPETTTGGRALKFYSSMRLDVRRKEQIKEGSDVRGYSTSIRIVKNKVAPPFKNVMCSLYFSEGISKEADIINLGLSHNVISKTANSWFSLGDEQIGHGFENARAYLKKNPSIVKEIENKLMDSLMASAGLLREEFVVESQNII